MNWPQVFFYVGISAIVVFGVIYITRMVFIVVLSDSFEDAKNTLTGFKRPDNCPPPPPRTIQTGTGTIYKDPPPPHYMNWEARFPKQKQRSAPLVKETECPFRRKFTKTEWLWICKDLCSNSYPNFGNWLWMEMNASVGDKSSCFFSEEEVRRVDAAAKRAGIVQEEEGNDA